MKVVGFADSHTIVPSHAEDLPMRSVIECALLAFTAALLLVPRAATQAAEPEKVSLSAIPSPVIFRGDAATAYRDPAAQITARALKPLATADHAIAPQDSKAVRPLAQLGAVMFSCQNGKGHEAGELARRGIRRRSCQQNTAGKPARFTACFANRHNPLLRPVLALDKTLRKAHHGIGRFSAFFQRRRGPEGIEEHGVRISFLPLEEGQGVRARWQ
jgi:hypothetical protein